MAKDCKTKKNIKSTKRKYAKVGKDGHDGEAQLTKATRVHNWDAPVTGTKIT